MPGYQENKNSRPRTLAALFGQPKRDRKWALLVRGSCIVGLAGLPIMALFPQSGPLVWFALMTVPANSVLAPFVPVSFELLIIEAAKHSSILWITVVGTIVFMYMEYLNWHIYCWALSRTRCARLGEKAWVRRSLTYFARAPFLTVLVFSFSPLPFWAVRTAAVLHKYPLGRFCLATAFGRAPRIAAYAWLGTQLKVPSMLLLMTAVAAVILVIAVRLAKRETIMDSELADVLNTADAEIPVGAKAESVLHVRRPLAAK